MAIIHWMAVQLKGIDIFDSYTPTDFRSKLINHGAPPVIPLVDLTTVQPDILPTNVIEVKFQYDSSGYMKNRSLFICFTD